MKPYTLGKSMHSCYPRSMPFKHNSIILCWAMSFDDSALSSKSHSMGYLVMWVWHMRSCWSVFSIMSLMFIY